MKHNICKETKLENDKNRLTTKILYFLFNQIKFSHYSKPNSNKLHT